MTFFRAELFVTLDYGDVNTFIRRLAFFDYYYEGFEFKSTESLPQDLMSELLDNFWYFYVGKININFFSYDFNIGFETIIEIYDENMFLFIG